MKLPFYSVAAIAMLLLVACSNGNSGKKALTADVTLAEAKQEEQKPLADVAADTVTLAANTTTDIALQAGSPIYTDWDKKIVKTAKISLELKDYKTFNTGIHDRMKSFSAYTAGEQQSQSDTRIENNLTIKVPVDQFDNLVNSIGGDGITILSKDVSTDDVSNEVIDTKARIEAKKELRDKYEELLKEAKTMKDILQVQAEINNIQEELEAAMGRVNYLTHSAAYSTITITYFQYLNGNSQDTAQPTFFINIKDAFAMGGNVLTNVLLFFVSIWPLLLAGGLLYMYLKRAKVKKATA